MDINHGWERSDAQIFWGEIAPCNHVVQIYENEEMFRDMLGSFVTGGFRAGDSVIVIATEEHRKVLSDRIREEGFELFDLILKDQYIVLDAEETLSKFMVAGWPDENLFEHVISGVLHKAKRHNRYHVRAFGEMVALLWRQGMQGATVHLEQLWNNFISKHDFCLFCAYPKSGFTENAHDSMMKICSTHSQLLAGTGKSSNDLFYKTLG
jgi:hypothetical protein